MISDNDKNEFHKQVESKEKRKLKADREDPFGTLYGLGLFGAVGWVVSIPAIIGVFIGAWIDLTWPGPRSWALMLMVLGLMSGCGSAWYWLTHQRTKILKEREDDDDNDDES
ncbi:MAG: AtpZ/AtpI family protein [Pseudodesulfovibrio sp.]